MTSGSKQFKTFEFEACNKLFTDSGINLTSNFSLSTFALDAFNSISYLYFLITFKGKVIHKYIYKYNYC